MGPLSRITRWAPWLAGLLGMALGIDAIGLGLIFDDHAHRHVILQYLNGAAEGGRWWELWGAAERDAPIEVLVFAGIVPWWTHPDYGLALFRPVSAATHYIDYLLWPDRPAFMHAHGLFWYGALVVVAGLWYRRRLGSGWPCVLGVVLYAVDEAHVEGVSWIAGRNTVVTAFFAAAALLAYERLRAERWKPGAWLVPASLALALGASEGGLAAWGFLLAHAVCVDRAPWGERARALRPAFAVTALWAFVYTAFGYGVRHGGFYLDPLGDPFGFASELPRRFWVQWLGLFSLPLPLDAPAAARHAFGVLVAAALVVAAVRDAAVRFWLLGTALASLPFCLGGPGARLEFIPSLGVAASCVELSRWLLEAPRPRSPALSRVALAAVGAALLSIHGPVAAVLAAHAPGRFRDHASGARVIARSWPAEADLDGRAVVVLHTWSSLMPMFTQLERITDRRGPEPMYVLGAGTNATTVTRIDAETFELRTEGGYLNEAGSWLARSPRDRFTVGQKHHVGTLTVRVASVTTDGRPDRVRVQAPQEALDRIVWVCWRGPGHLYEPVTLPAPGKTIELAMARG